MVTVDSSLEEKKAELERKILEYTKENVILAFSGGVDSSLLLKIICKAAEKQGTKVYAVTAHTKLHPACDLEIAKRVAEEAGAVHEVVFIDELNEAGIENNPVDRCYRCKKTIFKKMKERAKELGIRVVMEGTNEDDLHQYRPGIRALRELEIISPLADCAFRKKEIRQLAEKLGVSVANRPSTPCLATRLPYGAKISYERLRQIEKAEEYLRSLGFYNVRLRAHEDIARIEVDEKDLAVLLEKKESVITKIKELGFHYVTIDLEGFRSGSMDVTVGDLKG